LHRISLAAMAEESRTAVVAALLGNAALAVLKGIGAAVTGSAAMLAETFHSIADTGNQVLLMLGMHLADRPPDRAHPFGHGRNVYFWAFVVSVMLFTLGGAFSIWEGVHKFVNPGERRLSLGWTYGVLLGAFVFESTSLAIAMRSLHRTKGDTRLRDYWRENRDPTLPTVLLEDSGALLSLVIAAAGIGVAHATGRLVWDAIASGLIGLVLISVAVVLAFQNYSLLIGEAAPISVEEEIRRVAEQDDAVEAVTGLHTMHIGPESILVVLEVGFRRDLAVPRIEAAVQRLEERVAQALGGATNARLVVVEPSCRDDHGTRGAAVS
jgi:cation diffusion facilitator family transporter